MKLLNRKKVAVIMVLVIIASIFIVHNNNYESRHNNQNNFNTYYPELENFSIFEEETANQFGSLQFFKSGNAFLFNLFKTSVLTSIYGFANIFKWKYTAVINIMLIYNYSVFVVLFNNKKDGKKKINFVCS